MDMRKAISPIIATVILVAVTLVIAVAIVGWLMGLWGGLAGGSPAISITNQKLNTNGTLIIYVKNSGGGSDKLLSAELLSGGSVIGTNSTTMTISANYAGWITINFKLNTGVTINPGDTLTVKLYFENSGTQQFSVTAVG